MEKALGIYVAGPMVFWPGGEEITRYDKELCRKKGFLVPECVTQLQAQDGPFQRACKLRSRCVERLVQSDCIIANMDRFRGMEADSGTLFEVGMGIALGHRIYFYGQRPPEWMKELVYPDFAAALEACSREAAENPAGRKPPEPAAQKDAVLLAGFVCPPAEGRQVVCWQEDAGTSPSLAERLLPRRLRLLADRCQSAVVNLEDMPGGTEPSSSMAALCGYLYGKETPYFAYMKNTSPMEQRIRGAHESPTGRLEDPDGNMIEPFGLPLNLMLGTTAAGVTNALEDGVQCHPASAVVLPQKSK